MTFYFKSAEYCEVEDEGKLMKGSMKEAIQYLLLKGVSEDELVTALDELERTGHNVAEFGDVKKTFIFTALKEELDSGFRGNA